MKYVFLLLLLFPSIAGGDEEEDLAIALGAIEMVTLPWQGLENHILEIRGERVTMAINGTERSLSQKADFTTTREIGGDGILVEYLPIISRWTGGASDFYLEHLTIGFDGTRGFMMIEKEGGFPVARLRDSREITLLKKPREFTTIQFDNGLGAFLPFQNLPIHLDADEIEEFKELALRNDCLLTTSQSRGLLRIELTIGDRSAMYDYYRIDLSPEHGYSLVELEQVLGAKATDERPYTHLIESSDFERIEDGSGLYFPRKSRFRILTGGSEFDTVVSYHSATIRPNEGEEFSHPEPLGWIIRDEATGRKWKIE